VQIVAGFEAIEEHVRASAAERSERQSHRIDRAESGVRDEYDVETETVQDEGNGSFVFSGRASIDELTERLGVEIQSDGFDTVGGYLVTTLGRVPAAGEVLEVDGLHIEVLDVERRRVGRVRVRRSQPAPQTTGEAV